MKNRFSAAMFAGAMTLGLLAGTTALTAQEPVTGGTLRILGNAEVDRFDTVPPATAVATNFFRATQRQLLGFKASADPAEQITPFGDLATEVPAPTDEGKTYTFKLREGAKWDTADGGRQITSEDVARGFKRLCNPALGSPDVTYFSGLLVGFDAFCEGFAKVEPTAEAMKAYVESTPIAGIETPAPDTVVFRLERAANDFPYLLTMATSSPAPVEVLDYMPDSPEYRENYIASGPYTVAEYVPDSVVRLERNPAWTRDSDPLRAAYVDEIEFVAGVQDDAAMQQLQSGDGDMLYDIRVPPVTVQMLKSQGDEKLGWITTGSSRMIWLNTVSQNNGGALANVKVRQAINYAIDKTAIVQQLGGEEFASVLNGIMPKGILGYHDMDPYPSPDGKGDPEKAKALLAEAGYPDGLTLKLPYRNLGADPALAQVVQSNLEKAGFKVEISPVPPSEFYSVLITNFDNAKNGVWDMVIAGWSPSWPGGAARTIFEPQYTFNGTHGTFNFSDYNNDEANKLAETALTTTDQDESLRLWAEVAEMVAADAPTVPLVSTNTVLYHGPDVQNFLPLVSAANGDLTNVWLSR